MTEEKQIRPNSFRAWVLALRPKTLSAAAAPVLIAVSLAFCDSRFAFAPALLALLFASGMQIAANFINDLLDYTKGTDSKGERIGPKRVCAEGWIDIKHMKRGIAVAVTLSSLIGLSLLFYAGYELVFIGIACILFAYLYSGGPYPLSYIGMGDLLVLLFFGIVPVTVTYYILAGYITSTAAITALSCGLIVDTILVMNNYRDFHGDRESNKNGTLGQPKGRKKALLIDRTCRRIASALRSWYWLLLCGTAPDALYSAAFYRMEKNENKKREGAESDIRRDLPQCCNLHIPAMCRFYS